MKIQGLTKDQIDKILKSICSQLPKIKVYVFGSRISGKARKYSDLDLALDNGKLISISDLSKIKETLSATDIPIVIDLVDYRSVSASFKQIIDKQKKGL